MTSEQARRFGVAAFLSAFFSAHPAAAQEYPNKPIWLVVPFAPGGNADIIVRILLPKMSDELGQPIVIDHRGGAGGIIGTASIVRATPDGYTLLLVSAAHVVNPTVFKKLPYDSIKDFTPISMVADVPTAFVVHPSSPVHSVVDRIYRAARASLDVAAVKLQLAEQGTDPIGSNPDEYDAFNKFEIAKWARIAREANIQPE